MKIPTFPQSTLKPWFGGMFLAFFVGLAAVLPARSEDRTQESFPPQARLADYLAWAEDHHPAVAGALARQAALEEGARGAGALPDLRFAWGEMIVPVETRVGPQQRVFSLSQNLPWFGTLGLQEKVVGTRALAAAAGVSGQQLAVRHEVRAAWLDLALLQGEITILTGNLDLARQSETVTRVAYEAGKGSLGNILDAQIEVEKLESQLAGLRDRLKTAVVRLNLAAGLDAGHPAPVLLPEDLASGPRDLPEDAELWATLENNNPELEALRLETESRSQAVELAGRTGYPGLTLGLDYIMTGPARMEGVAESGKDPVVARLGVSIPLWGGKAGAQKRSAAGWLAASRAELSDVRRRLNARFEEVLYAWREARRNSELYGEVLIDSGRQALEVTSARYRSGQASYVDLVTSRKTLLGLELAGLRAAVDSENALNDLATLLGITYEELRDRAAGIPGS